MSRIFLGCLLLGTILGCSQSEPPVAAAKPINPGGQPRDAKESQTISARAQTGAKATAAMAQAAKEMAAARAGTKHP